MFVIFGLQMFFGLQQMPSFAFMFVAFSLALLQDPNDRERK